MKSEQANGQRQFQWWLLVAALALATAACNGKKEEPKGADTTKSTAKSAQQQAVTLEVCNTCCTVPAGSEPTITIAPGAITEAGGQHSVQCTVSSTGSDFPLNKAEPFRGHYLAVIFDDNPMSLIRSDSPSGPKPITLTQQAKPSLIRGYLAFSCQPSVVMKASEAAKAYCYSGNTWVLCDTPMVLLNLPEPQKTYPSADVPLDFVLNNAPLGPNYRLHVSFLGKPDTALITENKPFRIKNLPAGNHTVTVRLQKPKAGGGWVDVTDNFAQSSRTFTVQ